MDYDVVVVGAGPAGATAAKFLAENNVRVLLVDKNKFPREKPCGGMLFIRTLKRFPYIPQEIIDSYSYGCTAFSASMNQQTQIQQREPFAVFVIRKWFDQSLVRLATEQGVTFLDGVRATGVSVQDTKAIVNFEDGKAVQSRIVIGADGVWSVVARTTGLGRHYPNIYRCLFQELPLNTSTIEDYFTKDRPYQMFSKFMGIKGYAWLIPKKNCVNVGIGEIQPRSSFDNRAISLKEIYFRYLQFLKDKNQLPSTINGGKIQGGALPTTPMRNTVTNRTILCGDAAGLMNPLTGDGIHYAMVSGKLAADVSIKALKTGKTNASFLSQYQTLWNNDFGVEIRFLRALIKRVLKKNFDEKYLRILSKNPQILDMILPIVKNQARFQDCKWRIMKSVMFAYAKDFIC